MARTRKHVSHRRSESSLPRPSKSPGRPPDLAAPIHFARNTESAHRARHAQKCGVCNHPDRLAIEFEFLNWRNPCDIVTSYRLRNLASIYRHAHATELFARRRLNLRFALERIVERVGEVPITAGAVIRAIRSITHINDAGEWIEQPKHIVISRADSPPPPVYPDRSQTAAQPRSAPIFEPALLEEPPAPTAAEQREQDLESTACGPIQISPQLAAARRAREILIANAMRSREKSND